MKAIKAAIKVRPVPANVDDDDLLFVTHTGLPLIREDATKGDVGTRIDYVTLWMADLLKSAGLSKTGRGFYSLRHTFYTIARQTTDRDAVSLIAGHSLGGMADTYVEEIGMDRLRRVSEYVRRQVLGIPADDPDVVVVSSL